ARGEAPAWDGEPGVALEPHELLAHRLERARTRAEDLQPWLERTRLHGVGIEQPLERRPLAAEPLSDAAADGAVPAQAPREAVAALADEREPLRLVEAEVEEEAVRAGETQAPALLLPLVSRLEHGEECQDRLAVSVEST